MSHSRHLRIVGTSTFAIAVVLANVPAHAQSNPASTGDEPGRIVLAQASPPPAKTTAAVDAAAPAAGEVAEIVVTGTSIRGQAPVGSNLISVSTESLAATGAQTVTGALDSVPALSGITGQGPTAAFYQPSIHQLGASASNSTLVLIDGHRGPTGGTNHTFLDPNIVPNNMLERVEVLAEGSSSIYGSDAVAGVINFITRKKFDGFQVDASTVFRDGTFGYSAGLLFGQTGETFSAVVGATYIYQDALKFADRQFTFPDHRGEDVGNGLKGGNFLSQFCNPASINSTALTCTNRGSTDLLGDEDRFNIMGKFLFTPNERLEIGVDMLYSRRRASTLVGAGTVQATVFQSGAQANPFFTPVAGSTATSQTIRYDFTDLVGPAEAQNNSDSMYANMTLSYALGDGDWHIDALANAGRDESSTLTVDNINTSAALLALNGTTNGGGSLTAISIPGTTTIVTQLPLTTANALDVWNPAATNRTSPATIANLLDNTNLLRNTSGYQQLRANLSGTVFELPGGPVKIAFGGELYKTQLEQFVSRSNNSGPTRSGSQQLRFNFDRTVWSGFAELNVPLVSPDMNSFISRFDVSAAVRYDNYSEFGGTTNPKFAFNLDPIEGIRLRGNWSTSFVAPPLTIFGDEFGAFGTSGWNTQQNNVNIPVSAYPNVTQIIPSCAGQALCNIASLNGIQVTSGDPNAQPQKGDGWSLGFDIGPEIIDGLRAGVTYWNTNFEGGVTGPQIANVINTQSAQFLLTFYPGCATQAQISAVTQGIPQTNSQQACTSYIFRTLNSNWLNLRIAGIDYNVDYVLDTDTAGNFYVGVSGTQFTKFDQSFGSGPYYSILGTAGNNGTFPSIRSRIRGYLGWADDGFSIRGFVNYTSAFRNYSSNTVNPLTRDAAGNPNGGGDLVKQQFTFDLNVNYDFSGGALDGTRVSMAARNIFNTDPPFFNSSAGYNSLVHNPFGRQVNLTISKKF